MKNNPPLTRACAGLLAWAAIGAAPDPLPAAEAAGGAARTFLVREIELRGVRPRDLAYVQQLMQLRTGAPLDEDILNEDLHRIDEDGRYEYTGNVERDPRTGTVVIHLRERPIVMDLRYRVRKHGKSGWREKIEYLKPIEDSMKTRKGGRYYPQRAQIDEDLILRTYREHGYYEVKVSHLAEKRLDSAAVVFTVIEGPRIYLGGITFEGLMADQRKEVAAVRAEYSRLKRKDAQEILDEGHPTLADHNGDRDAAIRAVRRKYRGLEPAEAAAIVDERHPKVADEKDREKVLQAFQLAHMKKKLSMKKAVAIVNKRRAHRRKAILGQMRVRPAWGQHKIFDEDGLQQDLRAIRNWYHNNGYLDVEVRADGPQIVVSKKGRKKKENKSIHLHVRIDEGEQYRVGRVLVEGNEKLTTEEIEEVLDVRPGDVYNMREIQAHARRRVSILYGARGHVLKRVDMERPFTPAPSVLNVLVKIVEGGEVRVRRVIVRGNQKTKDHVIRRRIHQLPGQPLNLNALERSKRDLQNTGFFEQTGFGVLYDIQSVPDEPDLVDVAFDVKETQTGQFIMGFGFSSNNNVFGNLSLNQQNFDLAGLSRLKATGGGQSLRLDTTFGIGGSQDRARFQLTFTEPWVGDRPIRFSMSLSDFEASREAWDESHTGGSLNLGRRFFKNRLFMGGRYRLRNVRIKDLEPGLDGVLGTGDDITPLVISRLKGGNLISSLRLNLGWNTRDNVFFPSRGWHLRGGAELAGGAMGGEHDFYKLDADLIRFLPLYRTPAVRRRERYAVTLGLRLRAAYVKGYGDSGDDAPFFEQFTMGGITTLRGFDYRSVGPKSPAGNPNGIPIGGRLRVIQTAEITFPISGNTFRGAVFYEMGNVWSDTGQMDLDLDGQKKAWGFGIHLKTPISPFPIKIYWSKIIDRQPGDDAQKVQFTLGMFGF